MKLNLDSRGLVYAILGIVAVAIAFWMLVIGPKREEAAELGTEVVALESSLSQHELEIQDGEAARAQFPRDYQRLVVLGKAVPGDDDTASLLIQVNHIAERNALELRDLKLNGDGAGDAEAPPVPLGGELASANEVSAALLPLGATIGPAGLAVMPYSFTFKGSFFKVADFIAELDELVDTQVDDVVVDGRLVTLDAFALEADPNAGFPMLEATFAVTTYVTPPDQGITAGASPTSPGTALATPASATIGEAP